MFKAQDPPVPAVPVTGLATAQGSSSKLPASSPPHQIYVSPDERAKTTMIINRLREAQVLWGIGRTNVQQKQAGAICDELLANPRLPSIIRLKTLMLLMSIEQDTATINALLKTALELYNATVKLHPRGTNKALDKLFDDARAALDAFEENQAENDYSLTDPHPDKFPPSTKKSTKKNTDAETFKPKIEWKTGNQILQSEGYIAENWDPAAHRQEEQAEISLTFVDEEARQRQRKIVHDTEERLRRDGWIENGHSMLWRMGDGPVGGSTSISQEAEWLDWSSFSDEDREESEKEEGEESEEEKVGEPGDGDEEEADEGPE